MKKILSVLLAVVMVAMSTLTAFATTDTNTESKNIREYLYGLWEANYIEFHTVGEPKPYGGEMVESIRSLIEEAYEVYKDENSTDAQCQDIYDRLKFADYNKLIENDFALETYDNAKELENYNNWYSEESWNNFAEKRESLRVAIENCENFKKIDADETVSDAFYAMLYSYNKMTNEYTMMGDVNKDGVVNVSDVTLIQKYLVGEVSFTGGQIMLCGADGAYEVVNVNSATDIQKYIAGHYEIDLQEHSNFIKDLGFAEDFERQMERMFNFTMCPRIYSQYPFADFSNSTFDTDYLDEYYKRGWII